MSTSLPGWMEYGAVGKEVLPLLERIGRFVTDMAEMGIEHSVTVTVRNGERAEVPSRPSFPASNARITGTTPLLKIDRSGLSVATGEGWQRVVDASDANGIELAPTEEEVSVVEAPEVVVSESPKPVIPRKAPAVTPVPTVPVAESKKRMPPAPLTLRKIGADDRETVGLLSRGSMSFRSLPKEQRQRLWMAALLEMYERQNTFTQTEFDRSKPSWMSVGSYIATQMTIPWSELPNRFETGKPLEIWKE